VLSECRILVVDDNKDSAESLGMLLRLKGNEIRTAHDGLEAVELATTFQIELVLLDIGLPKLNGYEVARHIRRQPWSRDVILVALTGLGQIEDRRRSQEAGFNFHIVKPANLGALERLVAHPVLRTEKEDASDGPRTAG
jgi:CheY-like chemotaxis protein